MTLSVVSPCAPGPDVASWRRSSASAGIPTAWDMVWDFKQQLFISQRRVSPQRLPTSRIQIIRATCRPTSTLQGTCRRLGAPDEYAALFETVYPAEADRRTYLDAKIAGAKPSYGHMALATLMRAKLTRLVWTTNFDPLLADACAKVYDATGPLTTAALDAPDLAAQCIGEARWPVEVKLHGDFRSRRLKNTGDELRHQDVRLRQLLVDSCRRFGLVVAGYSGRDNSIMDALEEALTHRRFPGRAVLAASRGASAASACRSTAGAGGRGGGGGGAGGGGELRRNSARLGAFGGRH